MNEIPQIIHWGRKNLGDNFEQIYQEHHIGGFLYQADPESFNFPAFFTSWKHQWMQNQLHLEECIKLGALCKEAGIEPTLLKGMALVEDIYPHPGSRFMSDIDILVPPAQKDAFEKIIGEHGYELIEIDSWKANNFKSEWQKRIGSTIVHIEVHTRLFYHEENESWNLADSPIEGFKVLADEDQLVHLLGHAGFQHTFLKLYWMFDAWLLLQKKNLDWNLVTRKSESAGLKNTVAAGLYILKNFFGMDGLAEVIRDNHLQVSLPLRNCHCAIFFKKTIRRQLILKSVNNSQLLGSVVENLDF